MTTDKAFNTMEFPAGLVTTGTPAPVEPLAPAAPIERKSIHVGCPSSLELGTKTSSWNSISTDHIINCFDAHLEHLKSLPESDEKSERMSQLCHGQFDAGKYWNFVSKETGKDDSGAPVYVNVDTPELVREFLAAHELAFHMKMGETLYFKALQLSPQYMVKSPYASLVYVARQQMQQRQEGKQSKGGNELVKVDVDIMYNPKNNHVFFVTHDRYPRANTITVKLRVDAKQNLHFLAWLPGNDLRDPIMTPEQTPVRCGLKRFSPPQQAAKPAPKVEKAEEKLAGQA